MDEDDVLYHSGKSISGKANGGMMVKKKITRWNGEVTVVIKEKKDCYLALEKCTSVKRIAEYKEAKTKTKHAVLEII